MILSCKKYKNIYLWFSIVLGHVSSSGERESEENEKELRDLSLEW